MTLKSELEEIRLVQRRDDHWEIVEGHYASGQFHLCFKDGTEGAIATSEFPALASASDADFQDLQVRRSGLILENDRIEWDCAEAGLYRLIKFGSLTGAIAEGSGE